ncbi:chondroitinase-B domain-containing protein [Flavobacterium faecale]|nr:chondroitinase-B domain-containing protein [Flavobacterium faecale]
MKKITLTKSSLLKPILVLTAILFLNVSVAQTVYTSASTLQTAVNAAGSTGGTFLVKDGSYSGFKVTTTSVNATADKPIIIKPQSVGGVTFTGDSYFSFKKSANIILEGFNFNCTGKSTIVKFEGSNNVRVTRNIFKLTISDGVSSVKWVYIGGVYDDVTLPYQFLSHHNRVDHNIFKEKNLPGHYITIDGTNAKVQSQYDVIDHNHFKDNSPRATNEQESVRVGWSDMSKSSGFTTVEYNLFENCDGDPEVLSVKSCDNIIRHNTFRGNYGTLSFRHGNRNRAEGNYFFGNGRPIGLAPDGTTKLYTGGMRVYGTDHVIINNYFEGLNGTKWDAPITITQGDDIDGPNNNTLSNHFRAERVVIAYNTLVNNDQGIEIGFSNNGAYSKPVNQITIANNLITSDRNSLVKIVDGKDQGSAITWSNNLMYPVSPATLISGGITTTLSSPNEVIVENPNLVFDAATSTWKSSSTTPLYSNTNAIVNDEDIEGQSRPATSNPGADQYSTASVRYLPMTAATVGPLAYENVPLTLSPVTSFELSGETKTTTVTTNLAWSATVDSSWLALSANSGLGNSSIGITATANPSGATRTGILTVTGQGVDPVMITITQVGPVLTVSSVSNFSAAGEVKTATITSNVSWTASVGTASWFSINTNSGNSNGMITVTASSNTATTSRTGTISVTGAGLSPVNVSIVQEGVPSGAVLINSGSNGNPVTATATSEQVGGTNFNYAINSLDKNAATRWSDNQDTGVIVYDLGSIFTLETIKIATTGSTTKWYFYDIQFSEDGIDYSTPVRIQSAAAASTTFESYSFTNVARYVKIVGRGNNSNSYTTISEIEFYGKAAALKVKDNVLNSAFLLYPNPASQVMYVYPKEGVTATKAILTNSNGQILLNENLKEQGEAYYSIDVATLPSGIYFLKLINEFNKTVGNKKIMIKN